MSQKCHIQAPEQGWLPEPSAVLCPAQFPAWHTQRRVQQDSSHPAHWEMLLQDSAAGKASPRTQGVEEEMCPQADTANSMFFFQTLYNSIKNEKLEWAM